MEGVNAYKIPKAKTELGGDELPEVVDIGGFAYLWYPSKGILVNLQAVCEKFKTWEEVKNALGGA